MQKDRENSLIVGAAVVCGGLVMFVFLIVVAIGLDTTQHVDSAVPVTSNFLWQRSYLVGEVRPDSLRYEPSRDNWGPLLVPARNSFVLGDNRTRSLDSRWIGFIPANEVLGRVRRVYFSRDSLGHIRWSRILDISPNEHTLSRATNMLRHVIRAVLATSCFPLTALFAQGSIAGTITDSMHHRPLDGALVQIVADSSRFSKSVSSDSVGRFRFDSVPPGSYIIGFFHPTLDSLGLELSPRRIVVRQSGEVKADLMIPSAWTIETQLCRGTPMRDSTGLLLGHIRDADTQQPRVGTVTVFWLELTFGKGGMKQERQQIPTKTDAMGWFALCGLPSDAELSAFAASGGEESGSVPIRVPAGGLLMRDFEVSRADSTIDVYAAGDTASSAVHVPVATLRRGSARLTGIVRDYKGKPVANANVSVPGTGLEARTQETGSYSLANLPAGTQPVEVRLIGREPKSVTVDLTRNHLTTLDIALDRPVQTLDAVQIYGKGNQRIAEFERRVKAGWGHILTPADIEKRHAFQATDLFRTIPGVRVAQGRFGNVVLLRNCRPTVYLNGMRMDDNAASEIDDLANPEEITGVEVYTTASRPAEFWGNNCGSVVIWAGMMPR